MSTWTTPITWTAAAVTVAQANTEWRDHLNFLKGALDLVTRSTTADTGTATFLEIIRPAAANQAFSAQVSGDTGNRWRVGAGGDMAWSPGNGTFDTLITRTGAGAFSISANATANDTTLTLETITGQRASFQIKRTVDSVARTVLYGDATTAGIELGDGSATRDVLVKRSAAGELELAAAPGTVLWGTGSATSTRKIAVRVTGDAEPRFAIRADGQLQWGGGSGAVDTSLVRTAADTLRTDDHFIALDGFQGKYKAGTISDADFTVTPANGATGVDGTNARFYFRHGGAWHYVAQTAGFEIPEWERDCPQCGHELAIGQRVVGRIDSLKEDGARHGLWEHEVCA